MVPVDVVIVGGGPAGTSAALSLAKHSRSLRCLVLDDADPGLFKIGESLPPESRRLLHHIHPSLPGLLASGISQNLSPNKRHLPSSGTASAWGTPSLEDRHAIFNPFGEGVHLDRAGFDEMLRDVVRDKGGERVELVKGHFKSIAKKDGDGEGMWIVEADVDGSIWRCEANWVVDATGRKATVATKLGAKSIVTNPLLAFYALFTSSDCLVSDHDHRTIIEATPEGWFYTSLLSSSTRIVVFHTLSSHPAAKVARRSAGFLDLLRSSSQYIFEIIEKHEYTIEQAGSGGYPKCTAAGSSHLSRTCDSKLRWMAVGDAVLAFDPLSSQGMMTALEMGFYVGAMLAARMEPDLCADSHDEKEGEFEEGIEDMYKSVREEYEQHREYYYGTAAKRFGGEEFWENILR